MKNLFKEVFKSLFKNKATVIGLTILVFLTAGVFTVLNDAAKSMKQQYEAAKKKSVSHNITIDLNLSTNAKAYNDGYFVNGLSKSDSLVYENKSVYDKGINYITDNYKKEGYVIDLTRITDSFIPLSLFVDEEKYKDKYIDRVDFIKIYNTYDFKNENASSLTLDFDKAIKTMRMKTDFIVNLYKKENDSYSPVTTQVVLNLNDHFVLDKTYKLEDIGYITTDTESNVILSQVKTLFLNIVTKEATFDVVKGKEWMYERVCLSVEPATLAVKLGFDKYQGNNYIFILNKDKNSTLINIQDDAKPTDVVNVELNTEFDYSSLYDESRTLDKPIPFVFETNHTYNIPLKWAAKQEEYTYYQRKVYESTYVDPFKKNWDGAYVTFMENLIKGNNGELPSEFKKFSYWNKNSLKYFIHFDEQGVLKENKELIYENNSVLTYDLTYNEQLRLADLSDQPGYLDRDFAIKEIIINDLKTLILKIYNFTRKEVDNHPEYKSRVPEIDAIANDVNTRLQTASINKSQSVPELTDIYNKLLNDVSAIVPNNVLLLPVLNYEKRTKIPNYAEYAFDGYKTIAQIETSRDRLTEEEFEKLSNKRIWDITFTKIKNGALDIVKKDIYNQVSEKVGADNIGIKESITIDAFDTSKNEKFVYHFVNTGDNEQKIDGIKNNVNKLFNEIDNPTGLFNLYSNVDGYFKTRELPYYAIHKILGEIINNVIPYEKYVSLDMTYGQVKIYQNYPETKLFEVWDRSKIYKLAKFVGSERDAQGNLLPDSDFNQFAELGITFAPSREQDTYYIIKPVYDANKKLLYWQNVSLSRKGVSEFDKERLSTGRLTWEETDSYLENNKLTLMAKINPEGWVEHSNEFDNVVYLPFGYRAPLSDVLNEAATQQTLNKAFENIQKVLLDSDLTKQGFLTKDIIYAFIEATEYSANINKFATIFSSGRIDLGIIPKLFLDFLYKLSHNVNGDYANKLIVNLFTNLRRFIAQKDTLEERKQYLTEQIQKLFNVLNVLGVEIPVKVGTLSKFIKDPVVMLDSIIGIIESVNFVKFTEQSNNFFLNEHDHLVDREITKADGTKEIVKYVRKLSTLELIEWFIRSVDQKAFKTHLFDLLDNINIALLADVNDQTNPLYDVFNSFMPQLKPIWQIINLYPGSADKSFKNVIDWTKYVINLFDFDIFIDAVLSKKQMFYTEHQSVDRVNKYATSGVGSKDFIYALIKSLFALPGSNKSFKESIISMFNLSDKGTNIEIDDNGLYLTIPVADDEKLDYFDLLNIFISPQPSSTTEAGANTSTSTSTQNSLSLFDKLYNFVHSYKVRFENWNGNTVSLTSFPSSETNDAMGVFGFTKDKREIPLSEAKQLINEWIQVLNLVVQTTSNVKLQPNLSIGDIYKYFAEYKPIENNSVHSLVQEAIKKFLDISNKNNDPFFYVKEAYPLFKVWMKMFDKSVNADSVKTKEFALELLKLANNSEILSDFSSFDLIQPSSQNIVSFEKTGFGITKSLANTLKLKEIFFAKDEQGNYTNSLLAELIKKFPEYKQYVQDNELEIIQSFAYIATAELYGKFNPEHFKDVYLSEFTNIDSVVLENLIKGVFSNELFVKHFDTFNIYLSNSINEIPVVRLGISDALLHPLTIVKHPEVAVWFLTNTNNLGDSGKNKANIAYLIMDKIINFEELARNDVELSEFISSFEKGKPVFATIGKEWLLNVAFDNEIIQYWYSKVGNNIENYSPFGVNIIKLIEDVLNTITGVNKLDNTLKFDQTSSYIAKVNYVWLAKNNKKIYDGELPNNPIGMVELIKNLPEDYKINVNGSEFIIIGDDYTYDNIYPVVDEANLQVNTNNQAIVYVNSQGFDKIAQAYRGNVVKEYLLVKNSTNLTNEDLKQELIQVVNKATNNSNDLPRVYLDDEIDGINPERAIRITAVKNFIKVIGFVSKILLSILITLVAISIIFIIKRYITNKNKAIGILVSQGYTPLEISLSMTVFAFFTIIIGGIAGYLTGFLIHAEAVKLLSDYWAIPIQTLNFSIVSFGINIILPLAAMSILIIVVSIRSLRYKSIDLMSGITEVSTGDFHAKYANLFKKRNIKTKFSASLIFHSFWKLASFGISIILVAITTLFGIATFGEFESSIRKTYKNRSYNYKFDLRTPTIEGGGINLFTAQDLENTLYVPVGDIAEINQYQSDYFKPGISTAVNKLAIKNPDGTTSYRYPNGNPTDFDGHVISQFSVNIKIDSSVSIDPWDQVYNSLPDSQKSRITSVRNEIGRRLERTQPNLHYKQDGDRKILDMTKMIELVQTGTVSGFFRYVENETSPELGKFVYLQANKNKTDFDEIIISTSAYRDEYREFLINGYKQIYKENGELLKRNPNASVVSDFLVSFGGLYFDPEFDELYTYVDANQIKKGKIKNETIKLYGYQEDSKQIKIKSTSGEDLLKLINDEFSQNGFDVNDKPIPLIINEVSSKAFNLLVGSKFEVVVNNNVNRFKDKINEYYEKLVNPEYKEPERQTYKFIVRGINPTYINNEFIIPKKAADILTGLDKVKHNPKYEVFNGIMSKHPLPMQLLSSAGLYSNSGYWPAIQSFDTSTLTTKYLEDMFDALFGSRQTVDNSTIDGVMSTLGYSDLQIAKFINPEYKETENIKDNYLLARANAEQHIKKFANIFNNDLYIPMANTLDSKVIEVGYTMSIAQTVQKIVTIVTILAFIISIVILVIISTILIGENEKNIAIWSILGYNEKEKIKIFYGIYLPFILISILIAISLAFGFISIFSGFLTSAASIAIPIVISPLNILVTVLVILGVFLVTSILSWIGINKVKPIDLLKGK
ncbi:ABC transporter permease [Mycoplasma sp. 2248]|uniref:ABC transporter permease n=1 Tax=Mycoplasma sp. 2248 TaxID=3108528 RepID=UPI002B1D5250|nr:ABC transporter permease [Mycoplasma sp. 2248]MEA4191213.1 ABC transporter permease [Mycoplasma sp. 2248]